MISSKLIRLAFISLIALFIANCGGSGDTTSSNTSPGTGTVGILLTDKPADPDLFSSINATINKVELIGSDDDGKVVLYDGIDKTVDLLRLKNESIPFTSTPESIYVSKRITDVCMAVNALTSLFTFPDNWQVTDYFPAEQFGEKIH